MIAFRAKVTQYASGGLCFLDFLFHLFAVVAMKAVALDDHGLDFFAPENMFKRILYRGGAGAGRSGDCDDWMLNGHGVSPSKNNDRNLIGACVNLQLNDNAASKGGIS